MGICHREIPSRRDAGGSDQGVARVPLTPRRLVALGASNLTRGLPTVVSTARAEWGREVEVWAALGHGRSYGAPSRFGVRTLPGILESGLWRELEIRPQVPTKALVTDIGNDILYGYSAERILDWVGEAMRRLRRLTEDIVVTDLPVAGVRRLSRAKFLAFRAVFYPFCRRSLAEVLETAERVNAGLAALAATCGVKLVRMNPAWYGFDPIHIRPSCWRPAWQELVCGAFPARGADRAPGEALRLYLMRPERQWLLGVEQVTPQSGVALPAGARVWLY